MAKDVITRFKLETNQYDSALRDSTSRLKDFSKTAALAGKDFDRFTKSNVEAARALGTAATGATNAKDKVKELVSSYNSLANTYNSLSAIQKQSDFAKAMAESLTTLQGRIKDAKQELYGLGDSMKGIGTGGGFLSGIGDKMGGMLQVFGGNLMTNAAGWAMQQVGEMQELVKQSIEVARAAEGIKIAYDRLNQPDLLKNLKEATHGTVSELELMKAAVKFNDFKLPVEELGTMLAFAQQKAKDTGQSVDYMVDSIVTGLGRKSLMILDNLGLSAAEIKDKMAETGDMTKAVGAIIREQMAKAGDYVETAADRAAKANADLEDAMLRLGETFKPLTDSASTMWNDIKIGALDLLNNVIKPLIDSMTEAGRLRREIERINNPKKEGGKTHTQDVLDRLREYSGDKQGLYNRQLAQYNQTENTAWRNYNRLKEQKESFRQEAMRRGARESDIDTFNDFDRQIEKAKNQALAIQKLRADYIAGAKDILKPVEANIDTKQAEQNIDDLKEKLKDLEAQRKKAVQTGDQDLAKNLTKQINQTKSDIKALDPNALKTTTPKTTTTKVELTEEEKKQKDAERELETATKRLAEARQELATAKTGGNLKDIYAAEKRVTTAESTVQLKQNALQQLKDQTIKVNVEEGKVNLPQVPTDDQTIKVNVEEGKVNLPQLPYEVTIPLTIANLDAFKGKLKEDLSNADLGSSIAQSLQESMSDASAISTIMQTAIKNGIDTAQFDTDGLMQKLLSGQDISDTDIQAYVDQLNEQLKQKFDETEWPKVLIKFDADSNSIQGLTSGASDDAKDMAKQWSSVSTAISAVGSAMQQIDDPAAKVMGTIAQAIATVALTFSKSLAGTVTPWDWIAAAAAGTATMISTISAIKSATAGSYAEGGIIPGNSFTGDRLTANVNSGELILSRAQQDTIATQLTASDSQAGGGGVNARPYVSGEQIFLGLNNYLRASGRGEIITSRR